MPQRAWSNKRERQYEHIKDSAKKQGKSTKRAKEIAARTVNKERARSGEARTSSPSTTPGAWPTIIARWPARPSNTGSDASGKPASAQARQTRLSRWSEASDR